MARVLRPGGGGSFHGGSSGGYSGGGGGGGGGFGGSHSYGGSPGGYSSSGSGGGGDLSLGGIIVLVAFGLLVWYLLTRARRSLDGRVRDAILSAEEQHMGEPPRGAGLEVLQARDPSLTLDGVVARVQRIADLTREAWCAGDMSRARAVVSDGVYGRFNVQLSLMRAESMKNVMDRARTLHVTVEGVEATDELDVLHVRYTAEARDRNVPLSTTDADAARILDQTDVQSYTEIWSLVRRRGAHSKLEPQQMGLGCPNCGAPLGDGASVKCKYCQAIICSGEHDWVLAEITQASEWRPGGADAEGLDALNEEDPGTLKETLEDRASYLFWRWVESGRLATPAPLRKSASPAFLARGGASEMTRGARDLAVGGCDLVAGDPGGPGQMDFAFVKIYWSGIWPGSKQYTPMQSLVRLTRRSGVKSEARFTALVCPACGAPLTDSDSTRCDHCHVELADGEQQWVLDDVGPPGALRLRRNQNAGDAPPEWMLPRIADPRERMLLFQQMAAMMVADGQVGRYERRLLTMTARRWAIPEATVDALLKNPPALDVGNPGSPAPEWFLAGLVSAALADGHIDPRERAMLERACDTMSLSRQVLDSEIRDAQTRQQQQSAPQST